LTRRIPNLNKFVGATTREPRPGENENDYHFISEDEFKERLNRGEILEYSLAYGNYYGTLKEDVEYAMNIGNAICILDVSGKNSLSYIYPMESRSIFIEMPEDIPDGRLLHRNNIDMRRELSIKEHNFAIESGYDLFVINDSTLESLINKIEKYILTNI
jgi:guanylate kinase